VGEVIIGDVLGEFRSAAFAGHGEVVGELDQEDEGKADVMLMSSLAELECWFGLHSFVSFAAFEPSPERFLTSPG